jgi:hypothetical protein
MNSKARRIVLILALILAAAGPLAALAGDAPPGLIALEREVSLKIAHVRDEGPVDAAKRAMLSEAERLDQKGEQEITAADYNGASRDLLAANKILDRLVN